MDINSVALILMYELFTMSQSQCHAIVQYNSLKIKLDKPTNNAEIYKKIIATPLTRAKLTYVQIAVCV